MTAKVQPAGPSPHTAGIFADMTVDGPEIGTLVLVVDRAKNLPNRKTMGKQNPYCAARLGKEAKKTETDRRGGQTPKWDQELRFTVHDSPDYNNLKISAFSEDKRTDLIGEAWVSLESIIKPGGGTGDLWQSLNFKGRYAGELRLELTYYDARPKPERPESGFALEDPRQTAAGGSNAKVKRRPLPASLDASRHLTPDTIPAPSIPVRAKHGPRDLRAPARSNSMPPETTPYTHPHPHPADAQRTVHGQPPFYGSSPAQAMHQMPPIQPYGEYDELEAESSAMFDDPTYDVYQTPDFLPELPPTSDRRLPLSLAQAPIQPHEPRPHERMQPASAYAHSAPSVPLVSAGPQDYDDAHHLQTDYPEPIADLEYQHQQLSHRQKRSDIPPSWREEYEVRPEEDDDRMAPPPPPMHSNSAPVVPHYPHLDARARTAFVSAEAVSPPHARHNSLPNSSPTQTSDAEWGQVHRTPPHRHPAHPGPLQNYSTPSPPQSRSLDATPPSYSLQNSPSPYARPQPATRALPQRHSAIEPFQTTPSGRPHPLSHEVDRPRSPNPPHPYDQSSNLSQSADQPLYQNVRGRDAIPLMKPRALSPQPAQQPAHSPQSNPNSASKAKNTYNIQFPVRAFESSDGSPLSNSNPTHQSNRSTPQRKSVSPRPSFGQSTSPSATVPFGPDSFDVHNPTVVASRAQIQPTSASPHSPYHIRSGSEAHPRELKNGPIVGWHGQEIDPSDHLPVDSWAPEPAKKVPSKTYGLGRERDFGPRQLDSQSAAGSAASTPGSGARHLSKDMKINFRLRGNSNSTATSLPPSATSSPYSEPTPDPSSARSRLQKKLRGSFSSQPSSPSPGNNTQPLREHHNYNNPAPSPASVHAQQNINHAYSPSLNPYASQNHPGYQHPYEKPHQSEMDASPDALLAREISSIDIGRGGSRLGAGGNGPRGTFGHAAGSGMGRGGAGSSASASPSPVAFVPVRSHRDRNTYY